MPAAYLERKIVRPVKGSSFPIKSRGLVTCCWARTIVLPRSKMQTATTRTNDIELREQMILDIVKIRGSLIGRRVYDEQSNRHPRKLSGDSGEPEPDSTRLRNHEHSIGPDRLRRTLRNRARHSPCALCRHASGNHCPCCCLRSSARACGDVLPEIWLCATVLSSRRHAGEGTS